MKSFKLLSRLIAICGLLTILTSNGWAADTCPSTAEPLVSGITVTKTGTVSTADNVDYYQFTVPSAGTVTVSYTSVSSLTFAAGSTGCDSSNILSKANASSGSDVITLNSGDTVYVKVLRKNANTDYNVTVLFASSSLACHSAPDFFTIDGSEENIVGKSTGGGESIATNGNYYKFKATGAGGDINGTLKINTYSDNFNNISTIKFLDANCQVIYSSTNQLKWTMSEYITTAGTWYLKIGDENNNNPSVVTAMLWFPDINGSSGGGTTPTYYEPAIFKGTDVSLNPLSRVKTKIVNGDHNISVHVVKPDGTIYTQFKGSFMLELVDATNYPATECKQLPLLKYNGILGIDANDNGQMTTGDNSTAHGPSLLYDRAHRNSRYRMTYLVDPSSGGIIDYDALILSTGCVGNTQACLWGVLTNMVSTGEDPYLPDYSIKDVCGMHCQPGAGTGNNQVSYECSQCVFGQFGYSDCSDNFAIRPKEFYHNLTTATPLKAGVIQSGIEFKANDYNDNPALDYNESETVSPSFVVDVNISDATKTCAQPSMHFDPRIEFNDGAGVVNAYTLYNVGDFNATMHEIVGSEYALVDADVGDTPEIDRLITPFMQQIKVIPHHFGLDGNFTNRSNGFTYLSNFEDYNTSESRNISAALDFNITAQALDNSTTSNYTESCYAKDGNVTMTLANALVVNPAGSLTKMLWYDQNHDINGSIALGGTTYRMDMNATQFDSVDVNGTAQVKYLINFDRDERLVVNPMTMTVSQVTATDIDAVSGTKVLINPNNSANYVYGRIMPRDIRVFGPNAFDANGWYEVFGMGPIGTTALPVSKNDSQWSTNTLHDDLSDGDSNVTRLISSAAATTVNYGGNDVLGVEVFGFPAITPTYNGKAHVDTAPWLWYAPNALMYGDPSITNPANAAGNDAACLTHPCFNVTVMPAIGATGSAKSGAEGNKASKKSDSSGWRSTTDYAPAVR